MASMGDAQRVGNGGLSKLTDGPRTTSDLSKVGGGLTRGPNQGKKLAAAAWSETWPSPGSTLDLDFANDRGWVRGVGQGKSMDAVTFTRASSGNYVKPDGTLSSHANQGALGNHLLTFPQDFDNAAWTKTNSSVIANAEIAPDGTLTAGKAIVNSGTSYGAGFIVRFAGGIPSTQYVFSVYAKASELEFVAIGMERSGDGGGHYFDLINGQVGTSYGAAAGVASIVDVGNGWYRCSVTKTSSGSSSSYQCIIYPVNASPASGTSNGTSGIYIWGAQLELGSAATEYFPTNIGQPRFDWASTASTGAGTQADPRIIPLAANPTSNGLLIEESRANRILWCRDATQANWTKTNVTAAKDQTGIDGVANAASSLTATANNGTCIQTITLASGSRTGSVYLKRLTGTGNVQVSLDGSTYSTVDLSASEWRRIVLSGTVTNPTVGIKIAVSGDAVAMDYGQVEDGAFATSPILTTTASVTRAVDAASMSGSNFNSWYNQNGGTFFAEVWTNYPASATNGFIVYATDGSSLNRIEFGQVGSGDALPRISALFRVLNSNDASWLIQSGWQSNNNFEKIIFSYDNKSATLASSTLIKLDERFTLGRLPYLTQIQFQHRGYYKNIKFIPKKLNTPTIVSLLTK